MMLMTASGEVDTTFLGRGTVARSAGNLLPVTALMPAGGWLEARNQDVLQFDAAGRQVKSFHVPTPPSGTPTLNGSPLPGRFSAQIARIGALLIGPNNDHIYAFVDNSVNSIVVDVQTGRSAPIVGFGTVLDAAEGRDTRLCSIRRVRTTATWSSRLNSLRCDWFAKWTPVFGRTAV